MLLLTACSSTTDYQVVTQTHNVIVLPPAAFLTPCKIPFTNPPFTRDEAVERDIVWLGALQKCNEKPDKIRAWYEEYSRLKEDQ